MWQNRLVNLDRKTPKIFGAKISKKNVWLKPPPRATHLIISSPSWKEMNDKALFPKAPWNCRIIDLDLFQAHTYLVPVSISVIGIFQVPLFRYQKVPVEHQARLNQLQEKGFPHPPLRKKKQKTECRKFQLKMHYIHKFSWAISIVPHLWSLYVTFTHWLLSQPRISTPRHLAIAERLAWLSDVVTVVEPQKPRRGQSAQANIMGLSGWTHLGELELSC